MCRLILGPWMYQTEQLQINMKKLTGDVARIRGTWRVLSIKQISMHKRNMGINISGIVYELHLKRDSWFYEFNFALPACLLTMLALGAYLLPLDSGEKVSVPVSLFLSETLVLSSIIPYLPATTGCTPLISK